MDAAAWYSYFYPETIDPQTGNGTLRNLKGIRDPEILENYTNSRAAFRMAQLFKNPIAGGFDYAHMKAIHYHLFQDVYEWAGQERIVSMQKAGHGYWPAGPGLAEAANKQYALIPSTVIAHRHDPQAFINGLGECWCEINVVHSFREGNTRSQFVFFHQLAAHCGWQLNTQPFAEGADLREAFVQARFFGQRTGQSAPLRRVLAQALYPTDHVPPLTAHEVAILSKTVPRPDHSSHPARQYHDYGRDL
ncbi:Fic/DOC family protein [Trueperella pyogenes]